MMPYYELLGTIYANILVALVALSSSALSKIQQKLNRVIRLSTWVIECMDQVSRFDMSRRRR